MRNHIHHTPTRKIQMKQNKMIFAIAFAVTLLMIPGNGAAQDKAEDEAQAELMQAYMEMAPHAEGIPLGGSLQASILADSKEVSFEK